MISIARYMRGNGHAPGGAVDSSGSPILAELCAGILDYISVYVLAGEFTRLRTQIQEVKAALTPDMGEPQAAHADQAVRAVLSGYNRITQETLQNTAIEMQQMVGVLGHALTALSGGSDRSVSRMKTIQETIQRASTIQDVTALRASLRDVVQLIGEESSKEQQALQREREGIETHVVRFRDLLAGNPNRRLRDREEGIRAISDSLASLESGKTVWVMAFMLEQLKGIAQRYGPDAVDDLFLQLIRERLLPVAPAGAAFRWSPSGVVGIAQLGTDRETLQTRMATLNQAPLVHRIALGNRTAVLKVGLSHFAMEATVPLMDRLIGEVDRFTGVGTA